MYQDSLLRLAVGSTDISKSGQDLGGRAQATKELFSCTAYAMTARQLGVMALERLPRSEAQILKRAAAWPDCAEDYDLDAALLIAHSKEEIHLLPPVSKKQQRLQNALIAFDDPTGRIEVSAAWRDVKCQEVL